MIESRGLNPNFDLAKSMDRPDASPVLKAIDKLSEQLFNNPLTGLPNKKALGEFVNIFDSRPHDIIVTYIDLQGFGEINRNLGHEKADQKLCEFADFFKKEIRQDDLLFHPHGDEFVLLSSKRSKPGETTTPEEGLKHHLEAINDNSEVKFGFALVSFDKDKHLSLSDTITEADKKLMVEKERFRQQNLPDQVSTKE